MAEIPPHARCYARVHTFEIVCPYCAHFWVVDKKSPTWEYRDRYSQVLLCANKMCNRKLIVGLLLYPLAWESGVTKALRTHPEHGRGPDITPTKRQLAESRWLRAGGYWVRQRQLARMERNLALESVCLCEPFPWRAECPVHGTTTTDGTETGKTKQRGEPARTKPMSEKAQARNARFQAGRAAYQAKKRAAKQQTDGHTDGGPDEPEATTTPPPVDDET